MNPVLIVALADVPKSPTIRDRSTAGLQRVTPGTLNRGVTDADDAIRCCEGRWLGRVFARSSQRALH
jgi:hypothetical protein